MREEFQIECPHCKGTILIPKNQINCGIFRHGTFKDGNPINPHASKEECDRLFITNQIYGCGKPFRVSGSIETESGLCVTICDYI